MPRSPIVSPCLRHLAATSVLFAFAGVATAQSVETNIGPALGAGDETIAAGLALGFPFAFPDGTTVNAVDVTSNGRILQPGADTPDFSPTRVEFLSDPAAIEAIAAEVTR